MLTFINPGEIDPLAFSLMGVSAKPNSGHPIGRFGTGLKYAIACTTRLGGQIVIFSGRTRIDFATRQASFRGSPVDILTYSINMGPPVDLPFSLAYGQDWKPWQILRELESNARDEGGRSTRGAAQPRPGQTTIWLSCPSIEAEYEGLDSIFLNVEATVPLARAEISYYPDIYAPSAATRGRLYYRGVYVAEAQYPPLFTYNFLDHVELTEDRTLSSSSIAWLQARLTRGILTCNSKEVILKAITAPSSTLEGKLDWKSHGNALGPCPTFCTVVSELITNGQANQVSPTALSFYYELSGTEDDLYSVYRPNLRESRLLRKADGLLIDALGLDSRGEYKLVEALPDDSLGLTYKGKIYLSKRCLDMGLGTLVGTLFEELCHSKFAYADESRRFQQYLIDTCAKLILDLGDAHDSKE